jgi:hypothetical protein
MSILEIVGYTAMLIVGIAAAVTSHKRVWATKSLPHRDIWAFAFAVALVVVSVMKLLALIV